tara:strand:+ start:1018 stop:1239 length:222 start_codon:yes stop_codon:yes gene_type:complete
MKTKTRNLLFSEVDSIKVIVIFFISIILTSMYKTEDYTEQERPISVVSELQINKNKTNVVLNIPIIRIGSGIR